MLGPPIGATDTSRQRSPVNRKLIIFDFDGTLADTFPCFVRVFDEAAARYRFTPLDRANAQRLRGLDARQIMALHDIPLWKTPAIARFMRARIGDEAHAIRLFDGVDAALRALHARGAVLTIVTSNSRANVQRILGPQLLALFSQVECGAGLFGKLPKIRKVLAATGIAQADAVLIGDELRDARVAAEAGVDFGAVAWGFNQLDALVAQQPRYVFHQVADWLG
ncbi:phosphoglycolate phosphatase [Duganella sp. Leaf126]|nr:phosphoglycolate phosphatase [Duganella sp. Leaf126]